MEIKRDRMIHLGYGHYWRSDDIVGLVRIEEGRGPGRRTEVYVNGLAEPIIGSRTEQAILQEMASAPDEAKAAEATTIAGDLAEALRELSPVIKRMLKNEGSFDASYWQRRLERVAKGNAAREQEDLFG